MTLETGQAVVSAEDTDAPNETDHEKFGETAVQAVTTKDLSGAIVDAARDILVGEGYAALSMREIGRRVGCSATSIYLHFESKDVLVEALCDEGLELLRKALESASDAHSDPVERLEALCRRHVAFGLSRQEYYEIMFPLGSSEPGRRHPGWLDGARECLGLVSRTLAEIPPERRRGPEDSELAATVLWASLHGAIALLVSRRLDPDLGTGRFIDAVIAQATASCIRPA